MKRLLIIAIVLLFEGCVNAQTVSNGSWLMSRPFKDYTYTSKNYISYITNSDDSSAIGTLRINGDTLKAIVKSMKYGYSYIDRYNAAGEVLSYINLDALVKLLREYNTKHWRELETAVKRYRKTEKKYNH